MAHIISPITIGGTPRCCDATTKRTTEDVTGNLVESPSDTWSYSESLQPDGAKGGRVTFGICCASEVVVEFDIDFDDTGRFDPELPASASIAAEVKVNGVLRGSTDGTPITVTLDDRACGHTVEIISDATSTNYVGTVSGYVKLISIT